jgi:hypothetical protein
MEAHVGWRDNAPSVWGQIVTLDLDYSQQALFYAIKMLLGNGSPSQEEAGIALSLAVLGEHLAEELTDRIWPRAAIALAPAAGEDYARMR